MTLRNLECDPETLIGPVDRRVVTALKKRYPLEPEFLAYMKACHGGVPKIGALEIDGNWYRIALFLSLIDARSKLPGPFRPHFAADFIDIRTRSSISHVKDYEHMTSRALFSGLLPFAACQEGMELDHANVDLFCLDYRKGSTPYPVILWEANQALRSLMRWEELPFNQCFDEEGNFKSVPWDEFVKPVAPDFRSFVKRLQPVGNYFCTIRESFREPLAADCRTSTVCDLARAARENPKGDVMPVLADALMDAGCNNDVILTHCRSGGRHAKDCWVLDLILEAGESSKRRKAPNA